MDKVSHNNFLKVTDRGSMEVVGERAVDNIMRFEGDKIPSTPDEYVISIVNTIKGELAFVSIDNLCQWS